MEKSGLGDLIELPWQKEPGILDKGKRALLGKSGTKTWCILLREEKLHGY